MANMNRMRAAVLGAMALSTVSLANQDTTGSEWVYPQGLPAGHNGGFKERLVPTAADKKPHIWMLLFDDYGWANAGWHRNYTAPGGNFVPATDEVQTPNLNTLVHEGIELNRQYVYKYCSPTRSALQSGRNPYHVNNINPDPTLYNPNDPVSGFSAIPRNMTGMATKMAAAGYKTHAFGKWDAGMATKDHTPLGRGYMSSMHYFHHCNDYWTGITGGCSAEPATPGKQHMCGKSPTMHKCWPSSPNLETTSAKDAGDCCDMCASNADCKAWVFGHNPTHAGNFSCNLKTALGNGQMGKCTSSCKFEGCIPQQEDVVDLWLHEMNSATEGPARGYNNSCNGESNAATPGGHPGTCTHGPLGDNWYGGYEDSIFEQHVLAAVEAHDPTDPFFLFWAPHIVHAPLQVPSEFYNKFNMITPTDRGGDSRQIYHAMVNFADTAVGNVTDLLKSKGMWDNTIIVFSADNGGPIYNNGSAGANNFPLKGGKMNNWEGGIRVNSFISGGFLPMNVRGMKYEGLVTAWDYYATFCAFAGVDPTDHRAAAAGLPAIDSHDHSKLIMGTNMTSPRTEIPIGTEPRGSNVSTAPSCASWKAKGYGYTYDDPDMGGDEFDEIPDSGKCTSVNGVIVDEGANGLWKLLTGDVEQDVYTGPHYPNSSTNEISANFVGHCANGCLFDLIKDPLEANDLAEAMPEKVAELYAKIQKYETTAFNPDRGAPAKAACTMATTTYKGFWGPFVFP